MKKVSGILLDRILNPAGIKYLQTDGNQIFITGRGAGVDVTRIKSPDSGNARDTAGTLPGIENFSRYSYERAITRVTIGEKGKSQGSAKSYLSGRITNSSNGEPVIGAAVVDQGTGAGIISDAEGS